MPIDNAAIAIAGIALLAVVAVLLVLHYRRQQRLELRLLAGRERLLTEEMAACQAALAETDGSRRSNARATAEAALDALHTRLVERQAHLLNYEDLVHLEQCRLEAMVAARQAADSASSTPDDDPARVALDDGGTSGMRIAHPAPADADRPAPRPAPGGRRGYPSARASSPTDRPPEGNAPPRPPAGSRFGGSASADLDTARRRPEPDRDGERTPPGPTRHRPAADMRNPARPEREAEAAADGPSAAARGLPWLADRIRARGSESGAPGTEATTPPRHGPPPGSGSPPAKSRAELEEELRQKMRRLRGEDDPPPSGRPPRRS